MFRLNTRLTFVRNRQPDQPQVPLDVRCHVATMKTEPGGMSSRSPSFVLNMDGPSSLMRTVKLGEDGTEHAESKGPCVAFRATVHVGVRTVPGGPGQAALRCSTQEAVVRVARAYSTEAPGRTC